MSDDPLTFSCKDHPSALNIDARADRDEVVLVFSGEADAAAGPLLTHALARASANGHGRIAVDLAGLDFIDTHCLGILFDARERLKHRGTDLTLRCPQPPVRRLLDILRREDVIEHPRADGGPTVVG
jgi:anti-anti-sigma factor